MPSRQGMATTNSKKKRDSEEGSKWFQYCSNWIWLVSTRFNPFQLSPTLTQKKSQKEAMTNHQCPPISAYKSGVMKVDLGSLHLVMKE